MEIARDIKCIVAWFEQHLDSEVLAVRHLPERTAPSAATLLWPWKIEETRSQLPSHSASGDRTAGMANIALHVLLLPASLSGIDAVFAALHAQPVFDVGGGHVLHMVREEIPDEAICAVFQAAQSPMQLAIPVLIRRLVSVR